MNSESDTVEMYTLLEARDQQLNVLYALSSLHPAKSQTVILQCKDVSCPTSFIWILMNGGCSSVDLAQLEGEWSVLACFGSESRQGSAVSRGRDTGQL